MRLYISVLGLTLLLIGCAGGSKDTPSSSSTAPIAEQRLAISDFKRQGVRVG
jgi:hypothetical protein